MYSFNDKTPRAPESLGVAGHLEEKSQVFYNVLSSPRQIGRVADLVAARLRKSNIDLLRLRELITHTLYLSYRSLRSQEDWTLEEGPQASEPLQIEIGLDQDKIGFAISFSSKDKQWLNKQGLTDRLLKAATETPFEELLFELYRYSDLLVIKEFKKEERLELVCLMALPGIPVPERQPPFILEVEKISKKEVAVAVFTELGDLDYHRLLAGEDPEKAKLPSIGELIAKRAAVEEQKAEKIRIEQEEEQQKKLKVGDVITEEVARVSGKVEETDSKKRVISGKDSDIERRNRLGESSESGKKKSLLDRLLGRGNDEEEDYSKPLPPKDYSKYEREELEQFINQKEEQLRLSQGKLQVLRKRMEELEEELSESRQIAAKAETKEEVKKSKSSSDSDSETWGVQTAKKIINKIVGKNSENEEENQSTSDKENSSSEDSEKESNETLVISTEEESDSLRSEEDSEESENNESTEEAEIDLFSEGFTSQLESGGFDLLLKRARHELPEIKKLVDDKRVHKWMESLLQEMGREKEKINQFSKRLTAGLKKAEMEFKTKERSGEEEMKRLNEIGRQKDLQIERNQEQLSRMNESLERMKTVMRNTASDAQYKKRYTHVQKMYNNVKSENQELLGRLQEAKKKMTLQQAGGTGGIDQKEAEAMKRENMLVRRQADELRKTNKQLIERIRSLDQRARSANSTKQVENMSKRLEQAVRLANRQKRELDGVKKQAEQVEAERLRLQREITLLRSRLKAEGGSADSDDTEGAA